MKRGSMFKRFKERLDASGPGLIVAVIAMVLALTGGAFAAAGKLTGPQKKEVKKIAKQYAGKPGAPGATGPAGKDGTNGTNGKDGTNGTNGEDGKSVVVASVPKGTPCKEGGVTVEVEGSGVKKSICNGEEGEKGEEGSPWTAGGTLPPGATETGTWAYTATTADTKGVHVPLSFAIPLSGRLEEENVHYNPSEGDASCEDSEGPGSAGQPKAAPGQLCVYVNAGDFPEEVTFTGICFVTAAICEKGANRAGAILAFSTPTGASSGSGTFAVTAPVAP